MIRMIAPVSACLFLCSLLPGLAQVGPPPPARAPALPDQPEQPPQPPPPARHGEDLQKQILMQILANPEVDAAQMVPLIMLMSRGEVGGDALFPMLLMRRLSGPGTRPVMVRDGDSLLVVWRGAVQKVKAATLEVEARLDYRKAASGGVEKLKAALAPLLGDKKLSEDEERLLEALAASGSGTEQVLPLLMAMDEGRGRVGPMEVLLLSRLTSSLGETQPEVDLQGGSLFVLDSGVLYKIDPANMVLEANLDCRKASGADQEALGKVLGAAVTQAREKALQVACQSNLKQMCLAVQIYAQEHGDTLPDRDWVQAIFPYTHNAEILRCPSRPQRAVGYAINAAVVKKPFDMFGAAAETALFIEANLDGDSPVGEAKDVPAEGVHNGGINVGFVDGHVKWMPVDEARELMGKMP